MEHTIINILSNDSELLVVSARNAESFVVDSFRFLRNTLHESYIEFGIRESFAFDQYDGRSFETVTLEPDSPSQPQTPIDLDKGGDNSSDDPWLEVRLYY